MKLKPIFPLTVILALTLLTGCSLFKNKTPDGPVAGYVSIEEFFREPYARAWIDAPHVAYDRRLIHIGIPSEESVTVWYLLGGEDIESGKAVSPEILINDSKGAVKPEFHTYHIEDRHAGRIEVTGLKSGAEYDLKLRLFHGEEPEAMTVRTAPSLEDQSRFSFLAYSCLQPYSIKKGWNERDYVIQAQTVNLLNTMRRRAQPGGEEAAPAFMLGIGDQFYVDPGASTPDTDYALLHGVRSEISRSRPEEYGLFFEELYRRHLAIPPFDAAHSLVPSAMMWDDHEIRDGWGSQGDENSGGWPEYYLAARSSFIAYQAMRNPRYNTLNLPERAYGPVTLVGSESRLLSSATPRESEELFTSFDWSGTTVFMMDMRSARDKGKKRVITDKQFKAIATGSKHRTLKIGPASSSSLQAFLSPSGLRL